MEREKKTSTNDEGAPADTRWGGCSGAYSVLPPVAPCPDDTQV